MELTLQEAFSLYQSGLRQKDIAKRYGTHQNLVSKLLNQHPDYKPNRKCRDKEMFRPRGRREIILNLYSQGFGIAYVSRSVKTSKRIVRDTLKSAGVRIRPQGEAQTGKHNPSWKGGRRKLGRYWYIYQPDHPNATRHGIVAEHRLAMEKILGRFLKPEEVVHHKDKNPENNDPDNLELFPSNGKHLAVELSGQTPKWSEDGKRRISEAVRRSRKRKRIARQSRIDAPS